MEDFTFLLLLFYQTLLSICTWGLQAQCPLLILNWILFSHSFLLVTDNGSCGFVFQISFTFSIRRTTQVVITYLTHITYLTSQSRVHTNHCSSELSYRQSDFSTISQLLLYIQTKINKIGSLVIRLPIPSLLLSIF